jgi:hypothetical protein
MVSPCVAEAADAGTALGGVAEAVAFPATGAGGTPGMV